MTALFLFLPFVAGLFSLLLAVVSLVRRKPSPADLVLLRGHDGARHRQHLHGPRACAPSQLEQADLLADGVRFIVKSFIPVIWLCFSLTYSRSDYREFLARWRIPLAVVGLRAHRVVRSASTINCFRSCRQEHRATSGVCSLVRWPTR